MSTLTDQQVRDDFRLFAGSANPALAKEIAAILGVELGKITIGPFPNDETRVQIEESIRGTDIYIVQPTSEPANENLMELLITIDAMKRASASTDYGNYSLFWVCPSRSQNHGTRTDQRETCRQSFNNSWREPRHGD